MSGGEVEDGMFQVFLFPFPPLPASTRSVLYPIFLAALALLAALYRTDMTGRTGK